MIYHGRCRFTSDATLPAWTSDPTDPPATITLTMLADFWQSPNRPIRVSTNSCRPRRTCALLPNPKPDTRTTNLNRKIKIRTSSRFTTVYVLLSGLKLYPEIPEFREMIGNNNNNNNPVILHLKDHFPI